MNILSRFPFKCNTPTHKITRALARAGYRVTMTPLVSVAPSGVKGWMHPRAIIAAQPDRTLRKVSE